MIVQRPGLVSYEAGLALQLAARDRVLAGGEDELILLEHEPVVTLGRRGGQVDGPALAGLATPVISTDRGGLATWHGPGQLVAYPVVDLRRARWDVSAFVGHLGAAMVAVAETFGVLGSAYDACRPGVYLERHAFDQDSVDIFMRVEGYADHHFERPGLYLEACL